MERQEAMLHSKDLVLARTTCDFCRAFSQLNRLGSSQELEAKS